MFSPWVKSNRSLVLSRPHRRSANIGQIGNWHHAFHPIPMMHHRPAASAATGKLNRPPPSTAKQEKQERKKRRRRSGQQKRKLPLRRAAAAPSSFSLSPPPRRPSPSVARTSFRQAMETNHVWDGAARGDRISLSSPHVFGEATFSRSVPDIGDRERPTASVPAPVARSPFTSHNSSQAYSVTSRGRLPKRPSVARLLASRAPTEPTRTPQKICPSSLVSRE